MKLFLAIAASCALAAGLAGCGGETHTTVKKEVKVDDKGNESVKTETKTTTIDRKDPGTTKDDKTTTTTVKKESKVDENGNESVKTEKKTETKVGDDKETVLKIGPVEVKK